MQPDYLADYQAQGFDVLCLGHEAIVDLKSFTLAGGSNKTLRANQNRMTKLGFQAIVREPPLPSDLLEELRSISDEWLTLVNGSEKRFSLGWFDDDYIRNGQVMAIHTPDGEISAFATIVPEYQLAEKAVDLMRRRTQLETGSMDFLFISLFLWAQAQGLESFNLGMSPLSGVGEEPTDPVIERAIHYIYEHMNQLYNFQGLHSFKQKYHPTWWPRYLVYPGAANLINTALTITRVGSGDDFVAESIKTAVRDLLAKRKKHRHPDAGTKPGDKELNP